MYTLLTALIFLSTETHKKTKFATVFRAFDTDEDGCLTQDQILLLYRTICTIKPIIQEDAKMCDANFMFDDVLAVQEAQRCFNLTQDSIRRMENTGQMERN